MVYHVIVVCFIMWWCGGTNVHGFAAKLDSISSLMPVLLLTTNIPLHSHL